MPRSGPGPLTTVRPTLTSPALALSKPAMMRSRVVLPQPEAPTRQMNAPRATVRSTWLSAATRWAPMWNSLETFETCSAIGRSAMLDVPAQQPVVERDHDLVGQEAGDADHDHARDDQIGARQGEAVEDRGAEAGRHAGHLADHDDDPGEAEPEPQAVEDARQRRRQHDPAEHRRARAAEHRGGLEQLGVDVAHAEDGVEQDRVERAEEDQRDRRALAQAEEDHRQRQPGGDRDRPQDLEGRAAHLADDFDA